MKSTNKKSLFIKLVQTYLFHALFIFTATILLFIIILPSLAKTSLQLNSDLAFHAREIWELMQGRDFFFYYEEINYHGILDGLAAIPFFKLMGFYPIPFSLPSIVFYALFIWTTFLIVRTFDSTSGWIASILLLFPPMWVADYVVAQNTICSLIAFLGNLTLFYLIKIKLDGGTSFRAVFFLGFFSGLAIYAFTYSIIYIFTVFLVLTLTHSQWDRIRVQLTVKNLIQSFKLLETTSQYVARFLDVTIALFFLAILYSYIFGGFGLDIGGVTLIQINNLHKPVIQVAAIIAIRLLFFKTSGIKIIPLIKSYYQTITSDSKMITIVGTVGFLLGIFPRIISIVSGSISRGGQGFDMDFSPLRIILHSFDLITARPIEIMGLKYPLSALFSLNSPQDVSTAPILLAFPLAGLAGFATYSFIAPRWEQIKKIVRLEKLAFDPIIILLVFPATLCAATVIMKDGAYLRYLHPLYWAITIYVALLISRISKHSKILAITLVCLWISFYLPTQKNYANDLPRLREILSPNAEAPIPNVVKFLKSKGIKTAYATYGATSEIIMYSNGEIQAAQYNKSARGKILRKNLKNQTDFALVVPKGSLSVFQIYLNENNMDFKKDLIFSYWVIWDIKGSPSAKNKLKYLVE